LNGNIDDIEDLPDFINPATGSYLGTVTKCEFGERDNKKTQQKDGEIVLQVQITGVGEDSPTEEQAAAVGNVAGFRYYGEFGIKQFKKQFIDLAKQLNLGSVSEVVTHLNNGQDIGLMIKQRIVPNPPVNGVAVDPSVFSDLKAVVLV
jgi:hypothetical protein